MKHPIRYAVKDRWIDGRERTIPNPNPTVVVLAGHWSRDTGETELFRVSASQFREMTGRVVYGGDVDARGIQKFYVGSDVHAIIQARAGRRVRAAVKRAKQTPDVMERIRAIRSGNLPVLRGGKIIRRRR
jgi:hypothetical protein